MVATELKNNSCKLAKWATQSVLSGADQMKIGFVSRKTRADPYNHQIVGTQYYKPRDFASQITLPVNNIWGAMKHWAELFFKQEDGKFVIMRDPAKPICRVYKVPFDAFDDEDDEDEDDDDEDEGDEE